jgi:hypothetical protein
MKPTKVARQSVKMANGCIAVLIFSSEIWANRKFPLQIMEGDVITL